MKTEGIEITRENLRSKGDELRSEHGKSAMALMAWRKISKFRDDNWAIESLMFVEEANFFRKKGATVIGIAASEQLRFERATSRNREKFVDFNQFKEKDEKKRSAGIDNIVNSADFIVENDGTLDELKELADSIFTVISSCPE